MGIICLTRASPFRWPMLWKANDAPPAPPGEVQASTRRLTRSGWRSTNSCATMPPNETPMTLALAQPMASMSATASSPYSAIV